VETKLYVVVRDDIPVGAQAAQALHAAVAFIVADNDLVRNLPLLGE
jgi:peptidyl-tRNA hydrolase